MSDFPLKRADPIQAVLSLSMSDFQDHLNQALDAKKLKDAHSRLSAIRKYAELEQQEEAIKLDITEKLLRVGRRIGELVAAGDETAVPAGTDAQPVVTKQRLNEWRTFASVPQSKWEAQIKAAKDEGKLSARRLLAAFGKPKESNRPTPPAVPVSAAKPAEPEPAPEPEPEEEGAADQVTRDTFEETASPADPIRDSALPALASLEERLRKAVEASGSTHDQARRFEEALTKISGVVMARSMGDSARSGPLLKWLDKAEADSRQLVAAVGAARDAFAKAHRIAKGIQSARGVK